MPENVYGRRGVPAQDNPYRTEIIINKAPPVNFTEREFLYTGRQ